MKHLNKLTKSQFLNNIYNYELHPDSFVYIGATPSMVVLSSSHNRFCRELEPALEVLAKRHHNHYNVFVVDNTSDPDIAQALKVESFPVIYLCPVRRTPFVIKESINIREIAGLADILIGKM